MKSSLKIGTRVIISSDNEKYDLFKRKVLIVTNIAYPVQEHGDDDEEIGGGALYDFNTEDGNPVPFSLYEFEFRIIRFNNQ